MDDRSPDKPTGRVPPTWRQIGWYAVVGALFTMLLVPALYLVRMRRSPLAWFSEESFKGFGTLVVVAGVFLVLVLIGSHGDPRAPD